MNPDRKLFKVRYTVNVKGKYFTFDKEQTHPQIEEERRALKKKKNLENIKYSIEIFKEVKQQPILNVVK